jgi:hypothetical protein
MKTIRYRSGYKYQLAETYAVETVIRPAEKIVTDFIVLEPDGLLAMQAGYAWDGPSGPTIDTKSFMRGSLVHDAFYQLMRNGYLPATCREDADQELHRICREDGMCRFRAWYVLLGVRHGAGFAASPKAKKEIRTAP